MTKKIILTICLLALALSSFSCSKKKDEKTNAEIAYTKAMKKLKDREFVSAAEAFSKIDDDYPFSKWAIKAQTMAVYAYYKEEEYSKLISTVDDFIRLNPANVDVPYMMYMKGRAFFNQIPEIDRAQDNTHEASATFRELIARFPDSEYSQDARNKLSYIDEHLAGAKMSIGRYEIRHKNYVGAIGNFTEVTERYRLTSQVPEAYFRLIEIYYKIGIKKEALAAFNNLKNTFPNSEWKNLATKIDPELFQ